MKLWLKVSVDKVIILNLETQSNLHWDSTVGEKNTPVSFFKVGFYSLPSGYETFDSNSYLYCDIKITKKLTLYNMYLLSFAKCFCWQSN